MNWNRILIWSIFNLAVSFLLTLLIKTWDIPPFVLFSMAVGAGYIFAAFYTLKELKDEHKALFEQIKKELEDNKPKFPPFGDNK